MDVAKKRELLKNRPPIPASPGAPPVSMPPVDQTPPVTPPVEPGMPGGGSQTTVQGGGAFTAQAPPGQGGAGFSATPASPFPQGASPMRSPLPAGMPIRPTDTGAAPARAPMAEPPIQAPGGGIGRTPMTQPAQPVQPAQPEQAETTGIIGVPKPPVAPQMEPPILQTQGQEKWRGQRRFFRQPPTAPAPPVPTY